MQKKAIVLLSIFLLFTIQLCACSGQQDLVDMEEDSINGYRIIIWEGRTYVPFCVVSKNDRGTQIGYVNGDKDDRVSQYKNYPPQEWLVSWIPMDGGAMLLKEISVVNIPDGLEQEYE